MFARVRGFTLIEAMLAMALLAVLAGLAAPALTQLRHAQQVRVASIDLASAFVLAREEAITRRQAVLVVSQDGEWSKGWRIFVDLDADGRHDDGEPLLYVGAARGAGVRIGGNAPVSRYVRYTPSGEARLLSGAFQAGTLTVCHESGRQPLRRLVLSASGRLRIAKGEAGTC